MGDISRHFSHSEFKCKCGSCNTYKPPPLSLVAILEMVRHWAGKPVTITSGYRCGVHNTKVGGATGSKHLLGLAADIKVQGKMPKDVHDFISHRFPHSLGLKHYDSWVHVDVADRRWRGNQ